MALVLVISIGFLVPKAGAAQSDKYSQMAVIQSVHESGIEAAFTTEAA